MIFSIRNLGFELGSLLLEGWAAFAARVVCAALLLALGWLARQLLSRRVFPALLRRNWRLAGTPILLRSFAVPLQRLTLAAFIYAAAASLPWAIAGVNKFLLTVFELAATFFVCQGLYAAADLTDLLLASCGEEVRTNRTLTTLLNKVYKVLIVVLGVMTMAQESGLPVGSIVASAGLVGLTISLAAQDSAKNLFSGLVILLDRPFSIGDWITVGDVSGEVVDINFRSTKVRALDNSVYILTNPGFIGWLDTEGHTDLYVNLRCMEIKPGETTLYAGGGILASSEIESEWTETGDKMNTMKSILYPEFINR